MHCDAYVQGRCRSCGLIELPYREQLAGKQRGARELLAPFGDIVWLDPVASREAGFRNKAKMVVAGTTDKPTLGILDPHGAGVDLSDCPLYPSALAATFPVLSRFISQARLLPYDVPLRRGELKYLLLTLAEHSGELMLRFVLRSTESIARIRKHLPDLLTALPQLRVVSANIQAEHKAIVEGDEEIPLGSQDALAMRVNGIVLYLQTKSFFQTNTEIAAALYRQAREWVQAIDPPALWDLYCGVGGFALHCADGVRQVSGIETSSEAIASACRSRDEAGLAHVHFHATDATAFVHAADRHPPLIIVNPPRRGLGTALCRSLREGSAKHLVYSSCNAQSLARDLHDLQEFRPVQARLFDMFPHSSHYELCCLLERKP
ncbi:MAG TPA: 23S rRNA (uracil(747)-C(5))-methyltransferase RlmC [Chiayiivirga sp.]|nr:23S rRNA (uracil(747)-C(5))-methyltransferase RlmC [Chiayiivirga sp.]